VYANPKARLATGEIAGAYAC